MKKYSVTIYDLIGYLVPGLFLLLGLNVSISPIVGLDNFTRKLVLSNWTWVLVLSYLMGHLVQSVTASIFDYPINKWWHEYEMPTEFKSKLPPTLSVALKRPTTPDNVIRRRPSTTGVVLL